jgi:putative sigma-54 modulation protein
MNLNITARHFELTQDLKDFVEKKFKKLEHYDYLITKTDVILSNDAGQKNAEGKIGMRGNFIIAKTNANDIFLAIGLLADKLLKQIKTYDGKLKSKKRLSRSAQVIE